MRAFFDMGGYAAFVCNIVWARRALARSRAEARRRLQMQREAS